ncbi:MAG: phosphotransferase [Caldilineaceae bacterium]
MQRQPYDHYRNLLATLASDTIPLDVLAEVGQRYGWWQPQRVWQRTYGRFQLGDEPLVTLIYETLDLPQQLCVINLYTAFPNAFALCQAVAHHDPLGWFCVTRFPYDPLLPTLPTALALPGQPKVLRYRPGKRCTIRFVGGSADAPNDGPIPARFAKVFSDDRGAAIYRESQALWAASQAGVLDFAVARPISWQEGLQTLWQGAVPGAPVVDRLLSAEGPALAERLGRAAASLTHADLQPQQRTDGRKQQKRSTKYVERLCTFFPTLTPALEWLLDRLTAVHTESDPTRLRPIHGAPHPHQWLNDGTRLGLVDFDGFALGDPELDVATFMAEMDFEDWESAPVAAINARFQAGYEAVAGPLDERLLNAYRTHKRLSKALRNAYAVRADNDMRVERAVGQALTLAMQL